ncbi:hypothetical protein B0A55_05914 [Friedmanniomyces simplex]|uniref:DUF1996 domain-containing protein n=1 Tax=Friedmanniomyces simplex TaxID=329884 RepID=A0A4U0XHV6_9PEZI|nr:hypothetical protein B0A55_05914 [Friedmanniomyces simplex]
MKTTTTALALAALSNAAVLDKANLHKRAPAYTVIESEAISYTAGIAVVGGMTYSWSDGLPPKATARDGYHKHTVIDGATYDYSADATETHYVMAQGTCTAGVDIGAGETSVWSNYLRPRATPAIAAGWYVDPPITHPPVTHCIMLPASSCFNIDAFSNGGPGGPVCQLGDGQNRIGQHGLPQGKYCLDNNGGLTDAHGRGCILTPPTTQ